jgi:hypothetical protein
MNDVLMITVLLSYKIIFYKQTPMQRLYSEKEHQRIKTVFCWNTRNKIHFCILLAAMYTLNNPFFVIHTYGLQNVKYSIKKTFCTYTILNPKQSQ